MLIGGRAYSLKQINYVGELRLDFAEISFLNPHNAFQKLPSLLELKKKFNFFFFLHGPEEGNPFDCKGLRAKLLPRIKTLVDFAYELDARLVTVHFWLDQRFIEKEILRNKLNILEEIINIAIKKGIVICLENLSERTDDFEQAFNQFPQMGLTLDIGHGQLLTSKNTAYSFIEIYPERISHVHIHDNYGGNTPGDDLHLPLGEGSIAFESILRALYEIGYNRTITLEVASEFFKKGKERLKKILNIFPKSKLNQSVL